MKKTVKDCPIDGVREIISTLKKNGIDTICKADVIFDYQPFNRLFPNIDSNYMGMVEFYQKSIGITGTKSSMTGTYTKRTIDGQVKISDITLPQYSGTAADGYLPIDR